MGLRGEGRRGQDRLMIRNWGVPGTIASARLPLLRCAVRRGPVWRAKVLLSHEADITRGQGHDANASSRVLASLLRSRVSKPSVNQP